MKISRLFIYPVKSLAGISVNSARVLEKGLEWDRRWMLLDGDNQFMTQRVHPQMALIKTEIRKGVLVLHSNGSEIQVDPAFRGGHSEVIVWSDTALAREGEGQVNEWLSDQLHHQCRMVHMEEENSSRTKMNRSLGFADGYPYLILGESSMDDLNSRLAEPLSILRFRPNIVFSDGDPFEEDQWKDFKLGDIPFEGVKPCIRCVLTTVDPVTAEKGTEPLKTLATFRKYGNDIHFGMNAFALDEGILKVGNPVTVNSKQ